MKKSSPQTLGGVLGELVEESAPEIPPDEKAARVAAAIEEIKAMPPIDLSEVDG